MSDDSKMSGRRMMWTARQIFLSMHYHRWYGLIDPLELQELEECSSIHKVPRINVTNDGNKTFAPVVIVVPIAGRRYFYKLHSQA